MRVVGLMSGTSLDGVDAGQIETDGEKVGTFGPALTLPYEPALRAAIRELLDRAPDLAVDDPQLLAVTRRLTEVHAEAVRALDVPYDLIGFHGQTILHRPAERRTWQIGDAAWLARSLGAPVAYDFRSADVAAGGEGAPLVPIFHAGLAAALPKPLAILNIGGVANVTYLGPEGAIAACDTGPGNALLDDWVMRQSGRAYDADGALALAGRVDEARIARWLEHPYFRKPLPKSLDRLSFHAMLQDMEGMTAADGAATLAAFTAAAVAVTPLPQAPQRWLVAGGGRHNLAIMRALAGRLGAPVAPVESVSWQGDFLEAQCFAYLAVRVQRGLPLSFPETTGVSEPMRGGSILP
ncbi:anhydro-N-acetylmuramic acid kinase [Acidisoma sp. 7E03]